MTGFHLALQKERWQGADFNKRSTESCLTCASHSHFRWRELHFHVLDREDDFERGRSEVRLALQVSRNKRYVDAIS